MELSGINSQPNTTSIACTEIATSSSVNFPASESGQYFKLEFENDPRPKLKRTTYRHSSEYEPHDLDWKNWGKGHWAFAYLFVNYALEFASTHARKDYTVEFKHTEQSPWGTLAGYLESRKGWIFDMSIFWPKLGQKSRSTKKTADDVLKEIFAPKTDKSDNRNNPNAITGILRINNSALPAKNIDIYYNGNLLDTQDKLLYFRNSLREIVIPRWWSDWNRAESAYYEEHILPHDDVFDDGSGKPLKLGDFAAPSIQEFVSARQTAVAHLQPLQPSEETSDIEYREAIPIPEFLNSRS